MYVTLLLSFIPQFILFLFDLFYSFSDTGYVYDATQGLIWTAEPIPGDYTNPNVPGRQDAITPDGDQPFVDAAKYYCGNMTYGTLIPSI